MHSTIALLSAALPLLYGLVTANYIVFFVSRSEFADRTCSRFAAAAVVLHVMFIWLRIYNYERHPLGSLPEALSMIALALAAVYLYVERVQKNKSTGAFIMPMVVLLQLVSSALLPHAAPTATGVALMKTPLFGLHTSMAVLGYSAFTVGAVYSVMYLLLYHSLKVREYGIIFERLPSLDVLTAFSFGATLLGWALLSLAIGLGALMALEQYPGFFTDPKFIGTIVVWVPGRSISRFWDL